MSDFIDDAQVNGSVISAAWVDSAKGSKGIRIKFRLEGANPVGDEIVHDVWITPKTVSMAHKTLKTLGTDTDKVDANKFRYEIDELLRGKKATLVCGLEEANEYHAEDVWKVKFVNEYGDAAQQADPLALLRARPIAEKKKKVKNEPTLPLGSPAPAPRAQVTVPLEDDDVPF